MAFAAISSYAQSAYSALMLSENDYEGTARTAAMGNAFTALGGDIGAVSINPAATAVSKYSQFSISPGVSIISSTASGVSPYENGDLPYFQRTMRNNNTMFNLPNIGVALNFNTGRKSGIKSYSAAFIVNKTASYDQNLYAAGSNSTTSFKIFTRSNYSVPKHQTCTAQGPMERPPQQDSHRCCHERAAGCPPPLFAAWAATGF